MATTRRVWPAVLAVGILLSTRNFNIFTLVNAECECGYTTPVRKIYAVASAPEEHS